MKNNTKTNGQIVVFATKGRAYLDYFDKLKVKTEGHVYLKYAIKKVLENHKVEEMSQEVVALKDQKLVALCVKDDADKSIVFNDRGGYKFTQENQVKANKAIRALEEAEQEVKPYYVDNRVDDLPFPSTILEGFVYRELTLEEELSALGSEPLMKAEKNPA